MSSLETLLQAAQYLEDIETQKKGRHCPGGPLLDGLEGLAAHRVCNLPMSIQFHTYSAPGHGGSGVIGGHNKGAFAPVNGSTKNGHGPSSGAGGHALIMPMALPGAPGANYHRPISPGSSTGSVSGGSRRGGARSRYGSEGDKDVKDTALASTRHRELHKTLEKNRRAHLRHCFEQLKTELPRSEYSDKKTSHINIIHCAIRYIQYLKRTEWETEHEMERLARTKIRFQNQLAQVKEEILAGSPSKANGDVSMANGTRKVPLVSPVDVEEVLRRAAAQATAEVGAGDRSRAISSAETAAAASVGAAVAAAAQAVMLPMGLVAMRPVTVSECVVMEDGDVQEEVMSIMELDTPRDDDETTTTASECADDSRELCTSVVRPRFGMADHALRA